MQNCDIPACRLHRVLSSPRRSSVTDVPVGRSARQTMFQNRDYVFDRSYHVDGGGRQMTIVSRCAARADCPERPGVVRVNNYWSVMVIRPHTRYDEVRRESASVRLEPLR